MSRRLQIGVLAVQGAFEAHERVLRHLGHRARPIRTAADVAGLDGLVLPGGESTAQDLLIESSGLREPLDQLVRSGRPVLATCAGTILAASVLAPSAVDSELGELCPRDPKIFGWVDLTVQRNAYGRQLDSFETLDDSGCWPLVFIRAPRITAVGVSIEVLVRYQNEPVLIRSGNVVAATYHPELTPSAAVHRVAFSS